jgi:hypothetical protein
VIQDQLVRGIIDPEILADLLGGEKNRQHASSRLSLNVVDFVVTGESPAAVTPRRGACSFRGCDGPDHGGRSQRMSECPAGNVTCECDKCSVKGHYTRNCIKCKDCKQWGDGSGRSSNASSWT